MIEQVKKDFTSEKVKHFNKNVAESIRGKLLGVEGDIKKQLQIQKLSYKYNSIDMSFLRRRDKDGLPLFAVFSLDDPISNIGLEVAVEKNFFIHNRSIRTFRGTFVEFGLSEFIEDVIGNICNRLRIRTPFPFGAVRFEIEHKQKFLGAIPDKTKKKIKKAKNDFGNDIFIVAESNGWDEDVKIIKNPDPLVIGWDQSTRTYYLIDTFDLTTVEEMMSKEFTGD